MLAGFPGLPKVPFVLLGGGLGTVAWKMRQKERAIVKSETTTKAPQRENLEALLRVEPLAIEVGLGLVKFVDGGHSSPLLRRIGAIRRQMATDMGFLVPPIRVTDNMTLGARHYVVLLKGVEIARYELPQGHELAIPAGKAEAPPGGRQTREPAFGMTGWWIPTPYAEKARRSGFTVVDAVSVMGTHLTELIRRHAHEIFSRQETKKMLDRVALEHPKVVEDLVPKLLPLATVQRVLQNLLRERVSIRDTVSILEALSEAAAATRNPILLTEYTRQSIRRTIVRPYLNTAGDLSALIMDPALEHSVEGAIEHNEQSSHLTLSPQSIRDLVARIERKTGAPEAPVVVVTSSGARFFLRQLVETRLSSVFFIGHNEIPAEVKIISLGLIE